MRLALALFLGFLSSSAIAADPAPDKWQAKAREMYERAVEIPTVAGRGRVPELVSYLKEQFLAGGLTDVRVHPHGETQTMIVRWPAARPSGKKAILLMGHLDVVEAKREDWERDPFELVEEGGYFHGRGTGDNKQGVIAITTALLRLKAAGFRPERDIYVLFTGDEETAQVGAERAAGEWLDLSKFDYALNGDGGGGDLLRDGTPVYFGFFTAEKIYQSFTLTARNRGGHSSKPRKDNAIYDLARALQRVEAHSFPPILDETGRAYFTHRLKTAEPALASAIRRWLTDPSDVAAADAVEATESEAGRTRTTCVATRLEGGHADNALPQSARATVNCRIFPGDDPASVRAVLDGIGKATGVAVEPIEQVRGAPPSPLRRDVMDAFTAVVRARHPGAPVVPMMVTGTTDAFFFRSKGLPVYGASGMWGYVDDKGGAHGLNESVLVRAFYQHIDHWVDLVPRLAGPGARAGRER
jgi:acetylornithine deacetylase/succinyl-diaminopimelate desuccinylase-like protein